MIWVLAIVFMTGGPPDGLIKTEATFDNEAGCRKAETFYRAKVAVDADRDFVTSIECVERTK